jgi:hypothetical protein
MTVAKDASIKSFSKDFGNEKQATDALDIKAEEITLLPPRSNYYAAEYVGLKVQRPVEKVSHLLTKSRPGTKQTLMSITGKAQLLRTHRIE